MCIFWQCVYACVGQGHSLLPYSLLAPEVWAVMIDPQYSLILLCLFFLNRHFEMKLKSYFHYVLAIAKTWSQDSQPNTPDFLFIQITDDSSCRGDPLLSYNVNILSAFPKCKGLIFTGNKAVNP